MQRSEYLRQNYLVLILWIFGAVAVLLKTYPAWLGPTAERDFAALWVAGKLAASGHAILAFDVEAMRVAGRALAGTTEIELAYPYPPQGLFVAVPLSFFPLFAAFLTWQILSAVLFYIAARPYLPAHFPKILAILTPAAVANVHFGQVGLFFGALWLFAYRGSPWAAAALTFKPHLGLLVGIETVRGKFFLATCAIALGLLGLSALVFGVDAWRAWLLGAASHQVGYLTKEPFPVWYYQMVSPYLWYGLFGWLLFAAAAVALLAQRFDVFTAATASFLIAPYGFHYDMTVVCLGFGLLLFQSWRAMPPWQTFVAASVFLLPLIVLIGTWLAPPLLLAGLYVQTRTPVASDAKPAPAGA